MDDHGAEARDPRQERLEPLRRSRVRAPDGGKERGPPIGRPAPEP
jgi:hypothetical protein